MDILLKKRIVSNVMIHVRHAIQMAQLAVFYVNLAISLGVIKHAKNVLKKNFSLTKMTYVNLALMIVKPVMVLFLINVFNAKMV